MREGEGGWGEGMTKEKKRREGGIAEEPISESH